MNRFIRLENIIFILFIYITKPKSCLTLISIRDLHNLLFLMKVSDRDWNVEVKQLFALVIRIYNRTILTTVTHWNVLLAELLSSEQKCDAARKNVLWIRLVIERSLEDASWKDDLILGWSVVRINSSRCHAPTTTPDYVTNQHSWHIDNSQLLNNALDK